MLPEQKRYLQYTKPGNVHFTNEALPISLVCLMHEASYIVIKTVGGHCVFESPTP